MKAPEELRFRVSDRAGEVSALLLRPAEAWSLLLLGHGAGAGMRHPFMQAVGEALAARGIASFRYQFPYMEQGRRAPDRRPLLLETVRAALAAATGRAGELPLLAGGKSMGGRMTSLAAAEAPLPGVRGLVFLGFPLHPAGRPGMERGEHLEAVPHPLLFLQGSRDKLAEPERLQALCRGLGARATLHVVEGGDHSFHVLKRSGRSDAEILDELADTTAGWARSLLAQRSSAAQAASPR